LTEVHANIDVGFGNALFIRGEGDSLSWDKGVPLKCVGPDLWRWSTESADQRLVFKLLLNDQVWSKGADWTLDAGDQLEVVPNF
jgi:hypothetical protein